MILLTGATGFIGSHLVETLCARGEPVRCLVRSDSGRRRAFQLPSAARMVYGDLLSGAGLAEAVDGVDTVIHLAGVTKALSTRDYYRGNVAAAQNLAAAIRDREVRMVHVSSLSAAGPGSESAPVTEDDEPHPVSHYGRSKLDGERVVRDMLPEAVIVRPPVVYGPRDTDVFQVLKSVCSGLMLQLAGGERWFQAIYVKDLVEGLLAAARAPQAAGRTYFLAHSEPVSWSGFGAAAAKLMQKRLRSIRIPETFSYLIGAGAGLWSHLTGKPGIVSRDKLREAGCSHWTCDTRRASTELGFFASTSIDCGLRETLAWYKEAGWLRY